MARWPHPSALFTTPQYNRSYFVSWDAVFVATDVLLTSMGVAPMAGVDSQKHINTFLSNWQEGEQSGGTVVVGAWRLSLGQRQMVPPAAAAGRYAPWQDCRHQLSGTLLMHLTAYRASAIPTWRSSRLHAYACFVGTGSGIIYTPQGLAWSNWLGGWGNLRYRQAGGGEGSQGCSWESARPGACRSRHALLGSRHSPCSAGAVTTSQWARPPMAFCPSPSSCCSANAAPPSPPAPLTHA